MATSRWLGGLVLATFAVPDPAAADSRWIRLVQEASTSFQSALGGLDETRAPKLRRWLKRLKQRLSRGGKGLREWIASARSTLGTLWRGLFLGGKAPSPPAPCDGGDCRRKSLMVRLYEPFDRELHTRVDDKGIIRVDHTHTAQANRSAARATAATVAALRSALKDLRRRRATREIRRRLRQRLRKLRASIRQDRLEAAYHGFLAAVNKAIGRE